MDNIKDDKYYLEKIVADLEFLMKHTKDKTLDEIENDPVLLDSIMFRIIQIAENNSKLTSTFQTEHKNIPWMAIKGMRNRIVHDYAFIDMEIVYDTVTNSIPKLYDEFKKVINKYIE